MSDFSEDEVRAMLARHGLSGDAFDARQIAEFLTERTDLNDELDDLLSDEDRRDPTAFRPGWAR